MTEGELKRFSGYKPAPIGDDDEPYLEYDDKKGRNLQTAASLDWRALGKVTSVKDQGSCGSCYTFSAAGAMESAYAIKYNITQSLSTQQLLDCTGSYGNYGCGGGWMNTCFNYLKYYKLLKWSDYPYTGYKGSCKHDNNVGVTWTVGTYGYLNVVKYNPNALVTALNMMPVAAAVQSMNSAFYYYAGGIVDTPSCGN